MIIALFYIDGDNVNDFLETILQLLFLFLLFFLELLIIFIDFSNSQTISSQFYSNNRSGFLLCHLGCRRKSAVQASNIKKETH